MRLAGEEEEAWSIRKTQTRSSAVISAFPRKIERMIDRIDQTWSETCRSCENMTFVAILHLFGVTHSQIHCEPSI
jgi:hypothetical protein